MNSACIATRSHSLQGDSDDDLECKESSIPASEASGDEASDNVSDFQREYARQGPGTMARQLLPESGSMVGQVDDLEPLHDSPFTAAYSVPPSPHVQSGAMAMPYLHHVPYPTQPFARPSLHLPLMLAPSHSPLTSAPSPFPPAHLSPMASQLPSPSFFPSIRVPPPPHQLYPLAQPIYRQQMCAVRLVCIPSTVTTPTTTPTTPVTTM